MDPGSIIIFICLLAISAFFSGTEIALISTGKHLVATYVREKRWGAKSLEHIKKDPDTLLITILIGNNLVNVGASALATASTLEIAQKMNLPGDYGLAIVTGIVTLLLLMFGEITPKALCLRYAGNIALLAAPLYEVLIFAMRPVSYILGKFVHGVSRLLKVPHAPKRTSLSELKAFIDMSHEHGAVEESERRKIKNLLELSQTRAAEIMTPRVHVTFARSSMSVDEVSRVMLRESYSRLPVSEESEDEVIYYVTIWDVFSALKDGKNSTLLKDLDLEKLPRITLAESMNRTLEIFQKSHLHMALVVDEHGGTAGIVTLEDVIEEVFGDIQDETDNEEEEIVYEDDAIIALGRVSIEDVLDTLDITAEDIDLSEDYYGKSLAYICLREYGGLPRSGTSLWIGTGSKRITLTIISIHKKVIEKVKVEKI